MRQGSRIDVAIGVLIDHLFPAFAADLGRVGREFGQVGVVTDVNYNILQ